MIIIWTIVIKSYIEGNGRRREIKNEKSIRIRNLNLRNLRNFLRESIFEAFAEKERKLKKAKDEIFYKNYRSDKKTDNSERHKRWNTLQKEINDAREKFYASICVCRSCYRMDNDMVYFKELNPRHQIML